MAHDVEINPEAMAAELAGLEELAGFNDPDPASGGESITGEVVEVGEYEEAFNSWYGAIFTTLQTLLAKLCPKWTVSEYSLDLISRGAGHYGAVHLPDAAGAIDPTRLPPWGQLLAGTGLIAFDNFDIESMKFAPMNEPPPPPPKPEKPTAQSTNNGGSDFDKFPG